MSLPSVFVVILNYNGKETLPGCLSSVFHSDYPNMNVVVVDNASSDGSFEYARKNFSTANLIKNSANTGFARGSNVGIRLALEKFADYVFLLNNDAEIFPDTISHLVSAAEKSPRCGIISPLILGPQKNSIWFAGGKINWLKMNCSHILSVQSENTYATQYASGCAMLIKKEVFKKIGLFDEKFFLYYEDADLSIRASRSGFGIMVLPTAKALHYESSNKQNERKVYWLVLSALLFFKSDAPFLSQIWYLFFIPARRIRAYFSKNIASMQVREAFSDFSKG